MNIVFFGTPDFSLTCLQAIASSRHRIIGVVTGPDKPQGRHLRLKPPPAAEWAVKNNCKLFQFADVNSARALSDLRALDPDIFVVVSFGKILSNELLSVPDKGAINLHTSLLPELRGPAPIQRAIATGMEKTGVTVMHIAEKLDSGDIILQEEVKIESDDDCGKLSGRLASVGSKLLLKTLDMIENGETARVPQDEKQATYAGKFSKEEILINWERPAKEIRDTVRALSPKPCAHTFFKIHGSYQKIKILEARCAEEESSPCSREIGCGQIVKAVKDGIFVNTGKGLLEIKRLQAPGKKEMDAGNFINGHKVKDGDTFRTSLQL